jgi:hypothetical protein
MSMIRVDRLREALDLMERAIVAYHDAFDDGSHDSVARRMAAVVSAPWEHRTSKFDVRVELARLLAEEEARLAGLPAPVYEDDEE